MENQQKNQRSRFSDGSRTASGGGMHSEKVATQASARRIPTVKKKPPQQTPEKKAADAPKPRKKRKARANRARKARRRINIKRLLLAVLALLITAALAGGIVLAVNAYKNRTIHMLPEISDIEEKADFEAENPAAQIDAAPEEDA